MSQFHLTRADFPQFHKDSSALAAQSGSADEINKRGARKNKDDAAVIQDIHDKCMKLADGAHCAAKPGEGEDDATKAALAKRGARHSAADMEKIKTAHDAAVDLGAQCGPEPVKKDDEE